jgi:nucleotide-binding universal stress UspA family protein
MANVIISYDGTDNDRDALALGRLLGQLGASLSLAYVRHFEEEDPRAEEAAQREAKALLESGAQLLGQPDIPRYIVLSGSTGEGLGNLAQETGADMVVFGSDYRTTPGRVQPGTSAQRLLEGGTVAIGIAPAGFRHKPQPQIRSVAAIVENDDPSALETAQDLAAVTGAQLVPLPSQDVDMVIIGSRGNGGAGRVSVSAATMYLIETMRCPVIVVRRGRPVRIAAPAAQA